MPTYFSDENETEGYRRLVEHLHDSPIPDREILANLGLFLTRSSFGRMQFFYELYQQILDVPGIVVEFGVRWGQTMAAFTTFRSMLEPYNLSRRIVGFDTFAGFPHVAPEDGNHAEVTVGSFDVPAGYEQVLRELLEAHEQLAPRPHVQRFELVRGDVVETLDAYLESHPETVIALAYFDLDLYEPTRHCLDSIRPFLTRGSVVGFDEVAHADFPGETQALRETWGLTDVRLVRSPLSPQQSYFVVES